MTGTTVMTVCPLLAKISEGLTDYIADEIGLLARNMDGYLNLAIHACMSIMNFLLNKRIFFS